MKKIGIGCGVVAAVMVLLVVVVGMPYLSFGSGSGKMQGWADRDFEAELHEHAMSEAGLDAPGAVNRFDGFVAMVELFEEIQSGVDRPYDPQAAARVYMGRATEADLSVNIAEMAANGQALLDLDRLGELDAAIDALADASGFVEPANETGDLTETWLYEHMGMGRALARLFDARARIEAWSGDELAAAKHLDRMIVVAQPFTSQPALIGSLVGIAMRSVALVDVRRLAFATDDLEVLVALDAVLDRASGGPPISYTLECERLIGLAQLQSLPAPTLPIKLLDPSAQAEVLNEFYDRAIEWANTPAKERAGQSPGAWADGLPDSKYSVAKLLLPAVDRFIQADAVGQQELSATRLVVAVRRYEIAHGGLPPGLDALVPEFLSEVPTDPVSGAGFVYRAHRDAHTGAPFTLYSLGLDAVDGGGEIVDPVESGETREYDTNFTAQWEPAGGVE